MIPQCFFGKSGKLSEHLPKLHAGIHLIAGKAEAQATSEEKLKKPTENLTTTSCAYAITDEHADPELDLSASS